MVRSQRRRFLTVAGIFLFAQRALAQQSTNTPVIGLLDGGKRLWWWYAFRQQMSDLGYVNGKSILYEARYADGNLERLRSLAEELVRRQVSVIVTASAAATQAAKRATDVIPIVTASGGDHVSRGFATSLARPGGNITGLATLSNDLMIKRVELLRELFPKLSRLAVLWQSSNSGSTAAIRDLEHGARTFNYKLQNVGIRKAEDIPGAIEAAAKERADALLVIGGPLVTDEREKIITLANMHKLPTMYTSSEFVELGGVVSYGIHYKDMFKRAAVYVDKILKGAKPGELPIEQASRFELFINKKTAKSLGIAIPQSVLLRADQVIE